MQRKPDLGQIKHPYLRFNWVQAELNFGAFLRDFLQQLTLIPTIKIS